jgi:hypothetical protein
VAAKKKQAAKPSELERRIHAAMMLQPPECYEGVEIDCWGVTLVNVTRNPHVLAQLINDGRFGDKLGRALRSMIVDPFLADQPIDDHELRLVHSDGFGYALYSIARQGDLKLVVLAFQRGPVAFTETDKSKMFAALSLAEKLVRQLLEEEIKFSRKELTSPEGN